MKNIIALLLTALLLEGFLLPASLGATDFGLILNQSAEAGGVEEASFLYEANFIPRFSFLLGDSGEFIVTAGMTAGYDRDGYVIPELLRTELSWLFSNAAITAGRMQYSAPFDYVAGGLFDGFQFSYDSPAGTFNAGVWYTGLLYKKKANITVTAEDSQSYHAVVDYDNFSDTYFASRRIVTAFGWDHPSIAELVRVKLAVIAQADMNGRDDYLHSQYVTAKIGVPVESFFFELSGALELAETGDGFNIGLAGELGAFWTLPTAFPSRLSFTGHFSSGKATSGPLAAFTPITAKPCGAVLEAEPSGISSLSLDYTANLYKTFSAGLTSSYFIRSDLGTYTGYPLDTENNDGYFLGNEFFTRLVWSPVSDLQISLGGGIFLPSTGNASPGRESLWRIKLAAVLALY